MIQDPLSPYTPQKVLEDSKSCFPHIEGRILSAFYVHTDKIFWDLELHKNTKKDIFLCSDFLWLLAFKTKSRSQHLVIFPEVISLSRYESDWHPVSWDSVSNSSTYTPKYIFTSVKTQVLWDYEVFKREVYWNIYNEDVYIQYKHLH